MVDQFAELGVQKKKLYRVITRSPQLLLKKPEDFKQVFFFCSNQVYMMYGRNSLQVYNIYYKLSRGENAGK
jgi:hypothetical protein